MAGGGGGARARGDPLLKPRVEVVLGALRKGGARAGAGGGAAAAANPRGVAEALQEAYPSYRRMQFPVLRQAVERVLAELEVPPAPAPTGAAGAAGAAGARPALPLSPGGGSPQGPGSGGAGDGGTERPRPRAAAPTPAGGAVGGGAGGQPPRKRARRTSGGAGAPGAGGGPRAAAAEPFQPTEPRPVCLADLGGLEGPVATLRELVQRPLAHPEVYAWLGVAPPRGVLLHGPPGCGKTVLGHAVAREAGVPFFYLSAPEVVGGLSGESESRLRQLFDAARREAPCIVFIDEVDALAPRRESAQREMERRIVAQFLTCLDSLATRPKPRESGVKEGDGVADGAPSELPTAEEAAAVSAESSGHVVVLGATNRPDSLDPALRRAGRFDREVVLGVPGEAQRRDILDVVTRRLRCGKGLDLDAVARGTPGYVGADLEALAQEAAAGAATRVFSTLGQRSAVEQEIEPASASAGPAPAPAPAQVPDQGAALRVEAMQTDATGEEREVPIGERGGRRQALQPAELELIWIEPADFERAMKKVQPSLRREGFATVPGVTWSDVGGMATVRDELRFAVAEPIRCPERFRKVGIPPGAGVLLHGPPGCGKTLVAKACANESRANFISIKGPELLNKWVGESERAVRSLFARARAAAPCILFFDELDALAPKRGEGGGSNLAAERVVNQMLAEMDGVDGREGVYLVAATNRPDMIDPALLRPGRLDRMVFVPLPDGENRRAIAKAVAASRGMQLENAQTHEAMEDLCAGDACEGFSGADVAALLREAAVLALKRGGETVTVEDLEGAATRVGPSVAPKERAGYAEVGMRMQKGRGKGDAPGREAPMAGGPGGAVQEVKQLFKTPTAIASAEGFSFDHVVQRLGNKYSKEDLKRHIEELCDQGLLYYTNQLDRWKSTDE